MITLKHRVIYITVILFLFVISLNQNAVGNVTSKKCVVQHNPANNRNLTLHVVHTEMLLLSIKSTPLNLNRKYVEILFESHTDSNLSGLNLIPID